MEEIITRIFCDVHDFCKAYANYWQHKLLTEDGKTIEIMPMSAMDLSEIMTIAIYFHLSGYRCFKWYYKRHVQQHLKKYFPTTVSYNRFVELMRYTLPPLLVYSLKFRVGKCTGISFIDSTMLRVCCNHRIYSHKVFEGLAERGKGSMGWFYGFKLHLVINDRGELLSFCLTQGNVDDRNVGVIDSLCKDLFGRLFADRGYISQKLFETLFDKGIKLVTGIKSNMKNKLMLMEEKLMLRKRTVIESVNDFLKNICYIEHSRHRSPMNFLVNLIAGLTAYSFSDMKPSLDLQPSLFLENL